MAEGDDNNNKKNISRRKIVFVSANALLLYTYTLYSLAAFSPLSSINNVEEHNGTQAQHRRIIAQKAQ
uniref:Uncharacterized protein n=1 Tax=Globodera rostochiensis TaxID=31243 RepID=A0A914HT29_GLORO